MSSSREIDRTPAKIIRLDYTPLSLQLSDIVRTFIDEDYKSIIGIFRRGDYVNEVPMQPVFIYIQDHREADRLNAKSSISIKGFPIEISNQQLASRSARMPIDHPIEGSYLQCPIGVMVAKIEINRNISSSQNLAYVLGAIEEATIENNGFRFAYCFKIKRVRDFGCLLLRHEATQQTLLASKQLIINNRQARIGPAMSVPIIVDELQVPDVPEYPEFTNSLARVNKLMIYSQTRVIIEVEELQSPQAVEPLKSEINVLTPSEKKKLSETETRRYHENAAPSAKAFAGWKRKAASTSGVTRKSSEHTTSRGYDSSSSSEDLDHPVVFKRSKN
jgi:hypothetical protein